MKNFSIKQKFLSVALMGAMAVLPMSMTGCSTAWVTTLDNILVAAAPALIDILQIIAIAKGQPVDSNLAAKINQDAAIVKTDAQDFASASAAAAPTACAQLQAAINVYSQDEASVLQLAQVSNPAVQAKVAALSALVAGTVTAILAVIPSCQKAAEARAALANSTVPLPLNSFVASYNRVLVVPTGDANVDNFTKKHKVHVHNRFVRVISMGRLQ